jgi:acetyltransferase-like isoleucine patch superfamily enzyme
MFEYSWNGRIGGLPGLLRFVCRDVANKVGRWLTTRLALCNFGSHGRRIRIGRGFVYSYPGSIHVADDVIIGNDVHLYAYDATGRLEIGAGTWIDEKCHLDFSGVLKIGPRTTFSKRVTLEIHNHGNDARSVPVLGHLEIGEDVWLGDNCIVLPTVRSIGSHAIVGAGSIVTRDVPPHAIVAGNPARVLRYQPGGDQAAREPAK